MALYEQGNYKGTYCVWRIMDLSDVNGLLTLRQREYLLGEHQPENEAAMRHRIRQRVQASLRDFTILYATQDEEDRKLTFAKSQREEFRATLRDSEHSMYGTANLPDQSLQDYTIGGMCDAISYFYLGLLSRGLGPENFEELARNAIKSAVEGNSDEDIIAEVEVSVSSRVREQRLSELEEAYRSGEHLSADELQALVEAKPEIILEPLTEGRDGEEDDDNTEQ